MIIITMTIEYLDPRAEPGLPVDRYDLRVDTTATDLTIGMLANNFPDSVQFLEELATAVQKRLPGVRILYFAKINASIGADDQMLSSITADCQAVITAYGH
jgi:hypothetical protein